MAYLSSLTIIVHIVLEWIVLFLNCLWLRKCSWVYSFRNLLGDYPLLSEKNWLTMKLWRHCIGSEKDVLAKPFTDNNSC